MTRGRRRLTRHSPVRIWLTASAAALLAVPSARAKLSLGTTFSDGMVVQRDQPLVVWGEADANATVQVAVADEHATAQADADGHWRATVKPPAVGGPYAARVSAGTDAVELHDVLCGDVWLCAGQSNMQLGVNEDAEADAVRAAARADADLRLLTVPKAGADHPQYSVRASWASTDGPALDHFSAVAVHLGLALRADPTLRGVPVGLIDSSFGGTAAEGWTPAADLADVPRAAIAPSMFNLQPGALYNRMVAPLGPLSLAGVVWYQGENNAAHADQYPKVMGHLIATWRRQFDRPELPFVIVQLPPFADLYAGYPFTWVRAAQAEVVRQVPHTGLVVSIDTTNGFNLHPGEKGVIGRRAALQAERLAYGQDVVADGPTFRAAAVDAGTVRVTFDTHGGPLAAHGEKVLGFALAGTDGTYRFADARLDGDDAVVVGCPDVPDPRTVRYAWAAVPTGNLYNRAGLPAGPFRTDDQPASVPVEVEPVAPGRRVATDRYAATVDGNGNLVSLGVAKQQFVSNDLDGFGTANFPGPFGPRQLQRRTDLTPDSVRYSDGTLSLTYAFAPAAVTITIDNDGKDRATYHLRLADGVHATAAGDGYALRRGKSALAVTGADRAADDPAGGGSVELTVDGTASKTLTFKVGKAG